MGKRARASTTCGVCESAAWSLHPDADPVCAARCHQCRRALPPRPSLLVGGAEDCYREWARLEQKASALLAALPDDSTTGQLEQLEFALKQLRGELGRNGAEGRVG